MSDFRGKRISESYTMQIAAPPEKLFPLLCPEREKEWIGGWDYEMIYSQSGYAELGCTFATDLPPEGRAYWIMTRHVPPREGEYVRFAVGRIIVVLSFRLTARNGGTAMDATFTCTGISDEGNEFVARHAAANAAGVLRWMESALNHFIATGNKLQRPV